MEIADKVKAFIKDLIVSLEAAKLYSATHKIFKNSIDKAYEAVRETLRERKELVIGIIGEEFVFEKEIFFELSKISSAAPLITSLKERGIERITFYPHLLKDELNMFIAFLAEVSKEEIKVDPQKHLIALGIQNIAAGKLKEARKKEVTKPKPFNIYGNYLIKSSEYSETLLNNGVLDHIGLRVTMNGIMDNLSIRQEFLKLAAVKRHEVTTFSHIVNVSVLAMYFSSKLGFSRNDVLDIGTAALFHDTGKIYISRKVLGKKGKLTEEEFANIKSHTQLGAEILLKYVDTLGVLPVIVSFEHHLKYNLKGYPKLSFRYKPHIVSLIVSICDVYDALSQRRSYKYDYPPDTIYNIMMKEKGSAFEPDLLDTFFRIIGVWPIGTVVLLTDTRVAIVRQENEDDIFRPKIEAIDAYDRKESIDLKDRKEGLKIERALNPFTEGKAYLRLI